LEKQLEKQLIEKLKNKDPYSIKQIINKYNKKLIFLAFRFINNYDDAEDVIQEVWMKFFYSLKSFKAKSSIYTYLYRITINESMMWLRKNKMKRLLTGHFIEKNDNTTPEEIYLKNEKFRYINQAVKKLPAKQKKVFILRYQEYLPFKEIASVLNIKENNAKTLFFYSLKNIKKYLKEWKVI